MKLARPRLAQLGLIVTLSLAACARGSAAATTPRPPEASAPDAIGPLHAGLAAVEVVRLLGEPEQKGEVYERGADGMWATQWEWPSQGVSLELDSGTQDGAFAVSSMRIGAPCPFKTDKGVGVGSARAEVEQAYGKAVNQEESSAVVIIVGSVYGGIFFEIADGKVASIFIGAGAE